MYSCKSFLFRIHRGGGGTRPNGKPVSVVDLTIDPTIRPKMRDLAALVFNKHLEGANWSVLMTPVKRNDTHKSRKALTEWLTRVCQHPYFAKYALIRRLTSKETYERRYAISSVLHIIYHILWHLRVKIPGVHTKTAGQTEDDKPVLLKGGSFADANEDITQQMVDAMRRVSSALKTNEKNRRLKVS